MTKFEFLERLQKELEGGMRTAAVQEQLDYYRRYIEEEVRSGRDETEVVSELGDPWAIAKTILDTSENEDFAKENLTGRTEQNSRTNGRVFNLSGKWVVILLLLGVLGILMLSVAVIGGIIRLLAPILLPILVIVFVIRVLNKRR